MLFFCHSNLSMTRNSVLPFHKSATTFPRMIRKRFRSMFFIFFILFFLFYKFSILNLIYIILIDWYHYNVTNACHTQSLNKSCDKKWVPYLMWCPLFFPSVLLFSFSIKPLDFHFLPPWSTRLLPTHAGSDQKWADSRSKVIIIALPMCPALNTV